MDIHVSKDKDKDYDSQAAEMRKTRDSSVESKVNGPFGHNLPKGNQFFSYFIQYLHL